MLLICWRNLIKKDHWLFYFYLEIVCYVFFFIFLYICKPLKLLSALQKMMILVLQVYIYACMCVQSLKSCPTVCDPMDCSPPDSSVHGLLQAIILEWVAMLSSKGSSQPRDGTCVSCVSFIAGRLSRCVTGEALIYIKFIINLCT